MNPVQMPQKADVRTRTAMGPEGLEPSSKSPGKTHISEMGGAECGALSVNRTQSDADLTKLVEAWPSLPSPIQAAILAMVGSSQQGKSK